MRLAHRYNTDEKSCFRRSMFDSKQRRVRHSIFTEFTRRTKTDSGTTASDRQDQSKEQPQSPAKVPITDDHSQSQRPSGITS